MREEMQKRKDVQSFYNGRNIIADYYEKLMPACAPYCAFVGLWVMRGSAVTCSPWECIAEIRLLLPRTDAGAQPSKFTVLHTVHDADHYAYLAVRIDPAHCQGLYCILGDSMHPSWLAVPHPWQTASLFCTCHTDSVTITTPYCYTTIRILDR